MRPQPERDQGGSAPGVSAQWDWRALARAKLPAWTLAPLRLFLGVTFVYAGIQKLTDPQFFNASAPGYIGKQIQAFALGSPLHGLLLNGVLPHAAFWGAVIAWGEIAIGLGTLAGFLLRPASFFGLLLSLVFFLSASWRVHPYFYGADIVFLFGWLTVMLAGPAAGALPALDIWLAPKLLDRAPPARRESLTRALALITGALPADLAGPASEPPAALAARPRVAGRASQRQRSNQAAATRRDFIKGALVGGGVMLVASWLWSVTHPAPAAPTGAGSTGALDGGAATTAPSGSSSEIALVQNVPVNSSASFTIPSNGDPGVLVHLDSGAFVAFDATCTHASCPVSYDPSSKLLLCPCHGAAFDPSQGAAVVQGPTNIPLTPVSVNVNQTSGAITLN